MKKTRTEPIRKDATPLPPVRFRSDPRRKSRYRLDNLNIQVLSGAGGEGLAQKKTRERVTGRDCVRLQSKWLENNRAVCPVGSAGRKPSMGIYEGVRERERERGIEREGRRHIVRQRGVETTHRWQRIGKRSCKERETNEQRSEMETT